MKILNFFRYMKTLSYKIEKNLKYYEKFSTNPFLDVGSADYGGSAPLCEKTYIWIEKKNE